MKNCKNCYWYFKDKCLKEIEPPIDKDCEKHDHYCTACNSVADYKQGYLYYCQDCFLEVNGVKSFTVTHYTWDGEYMGNEDDIHEVIECVIENIDEEVVIL